MITRLFVENYKCMVNFEYRPQALHLLFGPNGTGKSTVFEILERLRDTIVHGSPIATLFPAESLTRWQDRPHQTFELQIRGNGGIYEYCLVIEHSKYAKKNRIAKETLDYSGQPLYEFDGQHAHLYRDEKGSEGPVFPFAWSRSCLATIPERGDNTLLTWFRQRMNRVSVFRIDPFRMTSETEDDQQHPDRSLADFASWYRHLSQEEPETMGALFQGLSAVIDGLGSLKLTQAGETARVLRASFDWGEEGAKAGGAFSLRFDELSDGQRCLVALFTILEFGIRGDSTICIDEPDNFVSLRELQPWLLELSDRVGEKGAQCLLVSHHPEFLNRLAVSNGVRFARDDGGPVRIKPCDWSHYEGLTPSEIVARGWEE